MPNARANPQISLPRAAHLLAALAITLIPAAYAQQPTPAPPPVYDAVVINPNKTLLHGTDIDTDDTTFQAKNVSLKRLIANAYRVHADLISGLPNWAESARFDLNAKVVEPDLKLLRGLSSTQRAAMLAALLADRFHLKLHTEVKTLPVYDLLVAKDGPKLKPGAPPDPADTPGSGSMNVDNTDMTATGVPLSQLAESLSLRLDRTVLDKTALPGRYDFRLTWTPENLASTDTALPADAPPIIFVAIQQQLGLKLQPAKGPVATLVIDHVDPPSAN